MQQLIQILQQALIEEHIPSEQVQNIISSIDISQLNLQDMSATTEYLTQFLGGMGIQDGIIDHINSSLAQNFSAFNIDNIADLGVNPDGIVDNIKNVFGGFFN